LEIDAKMKNSILFNNPEAIEPQNLLKTEAYAKNTFGNDVVITQNEKEA
jgi:hypothetical protein